MTNEELVKVILQRVGGKDNVLAATNCMTRLRIDVKNDAKIEDEVRVATVEKAKDYVTKFGGNITNVEEWGKKKLAYDIQHQSEGFYYFIQFEANADAPAFIEQRVRIMENVLRFLCVRKDEA